MTKEKANLKVHLETFSGAFNHNLRSSFFIMRSEQIRSMEEDREIKWKAPEKASKWTMS